MDMGDYVVSTVAPAIVLIVLPTIVVLLRLRARIRSAANLGVDDFLIIPALVCHIAVCACAIISVYIRDPDAADELESPPQGGENTNGNAGGGADFHRLIAFNKTIFALAEILVAADGLVKLSLLFLYRRLFASKTSFRLINTTLIVLIAAWTMVLVITLPLLCLPLKDVWDGLERHHPSSHCKGAADLYIAYTASDVLTDIFVLASPIAAVWSLRMRTEQKVWVSLVFLLGFISVAAGAVRVAEFVVSWKEYTHSAASSLFKVEVTIWSMVESGLGIICACLPCLPALFRFRRRSSQRQSAELRHDRTEYIPNQPSSTANRSSLRQVESWIALRPLRAQPSNLEPQ